ncbi:MAG: hypothetical protein JXA69_19975 [Phycisphaerae bacterium]|nr:hypothetical protein [Phycisphaerae bacterium]
MRILILTNDNFFSHAVLRSFLAARRRDLVGIVFSDALVGKRGTTDSLRWVLQNTGWRHFCFKTAVYGVFRLWNRLMAWLPDNRCVSSTWLWATRNEVPVFRSADINAPAFVEKVRGLDPELTVSVSMNQIVKEALRSVPRFGSINVHNAPLPRYAGMSPYVWALANGEDHSAATIHYIEEGLDVGDILVQEKVPVRPRESSFNLFWRCCVVAGWLLCDTVDSIEAGTQTAYPQDLSKQSYFSWPTKEAVRQLRLRGHRLARIGDFGRALCGGRPRGL